METAIGLNLLLDPASVALNLSPSNAILSDTNMHLINLLNAIHNGNMSKESVRAHLEENGSILLEEGESHYYSMRDKFNENGDVHDFLFLNRSCFNGLMRFNGSGKFNVPFCRKPERFRKAMVTKIVNQVEWAKSRMHSDWKFKVQDWRMSLNEVESNDMVYCDPPYVGRHADYYNSFNEDECNALFDALKACRGNFVLSNWLENKYRRNDMLIDSFPQSDYKWKEISHFYHVGPTESLRNEMKEVLIMPREVSP